jgi:uncharacterized protein with HEPN domain
LGAGRNADEIENDDLLSLAIPKALELIGESATAVPDELRRRYPDVEWQRIIAFRNILVHAYEAADYSIVVDVIAHDLPALVESIDTILADLEQQRAESPSP